MKNIYIIILAAFFSTVHAQSIITDGFSEFTAAFNDTSRVAHYILNPTKYTSVLVDRSSNTHTLVANGGVGDSTIESTYGTAIYFDGNNDYYEGGNIAETASSVLIRFYNSSVINAASSSQYIITLNGQFFGLCFGTETAVFTDEIITLVAPSSYKVGWTSSTDSIAIGWHDLLLYWNGTTYDIYLDGVNKKNATDGTPAKVSITDFKIGRRGSAEKYFNGFIYSVTIFDPEILTETLPDRWVGTDANYSKDINGSNWFASVFDTIGLPLDNTTLASGQEFKLTVDIKDTDGSGSANWWIGKKREAKTNIKTVTCNSVFTNKTVYFGDGFSLSSDTLWVAVGDTVSIDNVTLSKQTHHLKSPANRGWLGW